MPRWWARLGLPGLYDIHVHFLPPPIQRRVREHFAAAGPLIGREWPIRYLGSDEQRLAQLRAMGVRRFSALPYAHKPGGAAWMNDWAAALASAHPDVLRSATFYPEAHAAADVRRRLDDGALVFKAHLQVGAFDPRDPLLDDVWGSLADAGLPVVVHCGSSPVRGPHTGPGPMTDVLRRHPRLTLVVAHLGAPEYAGFVRLAERYERVHLDTTMAFTDFFDAQAPWPRDLLPRLRDLQPKVLLGSDFPSIPYPYAHQLEALERLELGDDWLRAVCWHNASRLVGERRV